MPRYEVCEELLVSQLARGVLHATELSSAGLRPTSVNLKHVRSEEEYIFQLRPLAPRRYAHDLIGYGRTPAMNKMLAFTSQATLRRLRCGEKCTHHKVTIVLEASGLGYYCTLEPHSAGTRSRGPLLKWSDQKSLTLVHRRSGAHRDRVYTRSNRKVFLLRQEQFQALLDDGREYLQIGAELAALQHLDGLQCLAYEGLGYAPALRAITSLTDPADYVLNLRGALLDFYGDPDDPDESEQNPWRCNLRGALFGPNGSLIPVRQDLMPVVKLCNQIDNTVIGLEIMMKLRESRVRIAQEIAARHRAPTGIVAAHWRRFLESRVSAVAKGFVVPEKAEFLLRDFEWRCRATSIIWRMLSSYVRLWYHQTGSWKQSRHTETTDRLRERINELTPATFGPEGILRTAPATTALDMNVDLTLDMTALAPNQKPKGARASATAKRLLDALELLRQEFLSPANLVPERFDAQIEHLFGARNVPIRSHVSIKGTDAEGPAPDAASPAPPHPREVHDAVRKRDDRDFDLD